MRSALLLCCEEGKERDRCVFALPHMESFFSPSGVFKLTGPASSLLSLGDLECVSEADQMDNHIAAVHFLFSCVPELAPPISL